LLDLWIVAVISFLVISIAKEHMPFSFRRQLTI